jgi:hypothetical protein
MLPRITQVRYLGDYRLELTFTTGEHGQVDFSTDMQRFSGVLAALRDKTMFAQVYVDPEAGTIAWPGDIDLDPDVLYARAMGAPLPAFAAQPAQTQ